MARAAVKSPPVAFIDEQACIGCTLCIEACPVDAIVGAAHMMHTVIAAECTGCRLCLPPCPVDCISMVETAQTWTHETRKERAGLYRRRHAARRARLERDRTPAAGTARAQDRRSTKQATVERAMQRARERLRQR